MQAPIRLVFFRPRQHGASSDSLRLAVPNLPSNENDCVLHVGTKAAPSEIGPTQTGGGTTNSDNATSDSSRHRTGHYEKQILFVTIHGLLGMKIHPSPITIDGLTTRSAVIYDINPGSSGEAAGN